MKIGIVGCGSFSACFVPLFRAHPLVREVVLADIDAERTAKMADENDIERRVYGFDELLKTDVDAVAIFTQRQLHGPMAVAAMRAGKHVYSAVPMGMSIQEIQDIVKVATETKLLYMMGETSYYYPCTIFCRNKFQSGEMGKFVYAEAQYHHDMLHFYKPFQNSGGENWRKVAGVPPMYYPTHSTSMILSCTGTYATEVSCMGYRDSHEDGIFRTGANYWDNVFSNESALMRTSDGGVIRVNEMRRIGWHSPVDSVYMNFYGELSSYEQTALHHCYAYRDLDKPPADVSALLNLSPSLPLHGYAAELEKNSSHDFYSGVAKVHDTARLPEVYRNLANGHSGSHQFLVDDFVTALHDGSLPPCNAWNSARWNIPGLVAHDSAKLDGAKLMIPDSGDVPTDYPFKNNRELNDWRA
jgi:predicted dehydrogenase